MLETQLNNRLVDRHVFLLVCMLYTLPHTFLMSQGIQIANEASKFVQKLCMDFYDKQVDCTAGVFHLIILINCYAQLCMENCP